MRNQRQAAAQAMIEWLSDERELGKAPDKIKCAGEFDLYNLHYYIFKFKKSRFGHWLIGVSGGYKGDSLEHCGHVFSEMETYSPYTAKDYCISMVELVREYWMDQAMEASFKEEDEAESDHGAEGEASEEESSVTHEPKEPADEQYESEHDLEPSEQDGQTYEETLENLDEQSDVSPDDQYPQEDYGPSSGQGDKNMLSDLCEQLKNGVYDQYVQANHAVFSEQYDKIGDEIDTKRDKPRSRANRSRLFNHGRQRNDVLPEAPVKQTAAGIYKLRPQENPSVLPEQLGEMGEYVLDGLDGLNKRADVRPRSRAEHRGFSEQDRLDDEIIPIDLDELEDLDETSDEKPEEIISSDGDSLDVVDDEARDAQSPAENHSIISRLRDFEGGSFSDETGSLDNMNYEAHDELTVPEDHSIFSKSEEFKGQRFSGGTDCSDDMADETHDVLPVSEGHSIFFKSEEFKGQRFSDETDGSDDMADEAHDVLPVS